MLLLLFSTKRRRNIPSLLVSSVAVVVTVLIIMMSSVAAFLATKIPSFVVTPTRSVMSYTSSSSLCGSAATFRSLSPRSSSRFGSTTFRTSSSSLWLYSTCTTKRCHNKQQQQQLQNRHRSYYGSLSEATVGTSLLRTTTRSTTAPLSLSSSLLFSSCLRTRSSSSTRYNDKTSTSTSTSTTTNRRMNTNSAEEKDEDEEVVAAVTSDEKEDEEGETNTAATDAAADDIVVEEEDAIDELVQDMLYRIRACNRRIILPDDDTPNPLLDFRVDGHTVGKVCPNIAKLLCSIPFPTTINGNTNYNTNDPVFVFALVSLSSPLASSSASTSDTKYLTLSEDGAGTTLESRTRAVGVIMNILASKATSTLTKTTTRSATNTSSPSNTSDTTPKPLITGWRNELYPVSVSFYDPPIFLIERAATSVLGILEYGVHINGIIANVKKEGNPNTHNDDGDWLMWMGRRSKTKSNYPGYVDHVVAGGQPQGISLLDNVIKECYEEAGIPSQYIVQHKTLIPAGIVSYENHYTSKTDTNGSNEDTNTYYTKVSRVVLFNYDLYLPQDFIPKPNDDEVEEFFLWNYQQLRNSLRRRNCRTDTSTIKPNCYLVIIDFLLRQKNTNNKNIINISPDTKGYLDIVRELRNGDCK